MPLLATRRAASSTGLGCSWRLSWYAIVNVWAICNYRVHERPGWLGDTLQMVELQAQVQARWARLDQPRGTRAAFGEYGKPEGSGQVRLGSRVAVGNRQATDG